MSDWFKPEEKLPTDGQECLLMPKDHGGLCTVGVFGPITWDGRLGAWMDLFRDPEAGAVVKKEMVGVWRDWQSIAPPETD